MGARDLGKCQSLPKEVVERITACDYVVGSDEVGYGAWAGPLVVCAVVLSKDWPMIHLVKDSKAFTGDGAHSRREAVVKQILPTLTYALVSISPSEIDEKGVGKVLLLAHSRAIDQVIAKHESMGVTGTNAVIVDGTLKVMYGGFHEALSLPKGDTLIPAISAASIVGKVTRDLAMIRLSKKFPGYGFENHMGYGTPAHIEGLDKLGPCPIHRRSYAPIRERLEKSSEVQEAWKFFEEPE